MAGVEWAEYRHSSVTQVLSAETVNCLGEKEVMPELGRYHLFRTSLFPPYQQQDAEKERLLICTTRPTGMVLRQDPRSEPVSGFSLAPWPWLLEARGDWLPGLTSGAGQSPTGPGQAGWGWAETVTVGAVSEGPGLHKKTSARVK